MLYILLIYISDLKLAELENSDDIFDKIKSLNSIKDFEEVNLLKVETFDENVSMQAGNVVEIDSDSDFGINSSFGSSILGAAGQEIVDSITNPRVSSALWEDVPGKSVLSSCFNFFSAMTKKCYRENKYEACLMDRKYLIHLP